MSKHLKSACIIILLIIICCTGLMIHFHSTEQASQTHANQTQMLQNKAQNRYNKHSQELMNSVAHKSSKSKNPTLRAFGINKTNMNLITKNIDLFDFGVYTWNNEKQYNNRAKSINYTASQNVLNNKSIFSSDKDSSGESSINLLGTHCAYLNSKITIESKNGNTINALVVANYIPWQTSRHETKSTADHNAQWMDMKLDATTGQIESIKKLYHDINTNG